MTDAAKVEAYFAKLAPPVDEIAVALRACIETHGPHLSTKLAWGHPCWIGNERVVSVIAQSRHCNLQLWSGARLADRFARIEGTGKQLRHVKVRAVSDIDTGIDDILEAAIDLDRTDPQRVR